MTDQEHKTEAAGGLSAVDRSVGRHATNEDDVLDVQDAVRLLRMISEGWAYSKDCDLGDSHRKATIRDASKYAKAALERLEPCYSRMLRGLPR